MKGRLLISILFITICLATSLQGQTLFEIEGGFVFTGYSDVRIPGDTGTLFSLSDELIAESPPYMRVKVTQYLGKRHILSALYAPLIVLSDGNLDKVIDFAGEQFPAHTNLNATYRFDSYRITYRYDFIKKPKTEFGLGFTAKIRDAEISLSGAGLSASKSNTGFVPIINFRLNHVLSERVSLLLEGDALAAPQGRAEDIQMAAFYQFAEKVRFKLGYRILEGGADNDEVYNFALFHYLNLGVEFRQ